MEIQYKIIFIIGAPLSGKSTIAAMINEIFHIPHISFCYKKLPKAKKLFMPNLSSIQLIYAQIKSFLVRKDYDEAILDDYFCFDNVFSTKKQADYIFSHLKKDFKNILITNIIVDDKNLYTQNSFHTIEEEKTYKKQLAHWQKNKNNLITFLQENKYKLFCKTITVHNSNEGFTFPIFDKYIDGNEDFYEKEMLKVAL